MRDRMRPPRQHLRPVDGKSVFAAGHAAGGRVPGRGLRWFRVGDAAMTAHLFEVEGLHASAGGREVLHGIDLTVRSGEVHVIMGPNGSGKSTLAHALMGRPGTEVTSGSIRMDGVELVDAPSWERARAGMFLALQHPVEVPGV